MRNLLSKNLDIKEKIDEVFPEVKISESDLEECRKSLIYLGKAVFLYSLRSRSTHD